MTGGPYDPRAVANLMLDEADRSGIKVTDLALQKFLCFAHSIFLIEAKRPLVSGYFEAWQYGPVHPAAYLAFKTAGSSPIDFRATGQNVMTGERHALALPEDPAIRRHLARIMSSYGQLSPGRLVDISHAKGAPWDYVADKGRTSVDFHRTWHPQHPDHDPLPWRPGTRAPIRGDDGSADCSMGPRPPAIRRGVNMTSWTRF